LSLPLCWNEVWCYTAWRGIAMQPHITLQTFKFCRCFVLCITRDTAPGSLLSVIVYCLAFQVV
jgi:hypothetical protein